jgi:hypothetical protein
MYPHVSTYVFLLDFVLEDVASPYTSHSWIKGAAGSTLFLCMRGVRGISNRSLAHFARLVVRVGLRQSNMKPDLENKLHETNNMSGTVLTVRVADRMPCPENILYNVPLRCYALLRVCSIKGQQDARLWEYTLQLANRLPGPENILLKRPI